MLLITLCALFWISLVGVAYSYFFYPLLLHFLARTLGKHHHTSGNSYPRVAVLVPVYNEEEVIRAKIQNILACDYPEDKLTIWIGSDSSSDATHAIIESLSNPRVRLWVSPERVGKTGILNRLAPQIDADVILFTDANTMHNVDSIKRLVAHYDDPSIGGVAGEIRHLIAVGDGLGETFYRSFESRQKLCESMLHSTVSGYGGFYSIRASLFRPIPSNAYSNDDVLIPLNVIRQKYRFIFEPTAVSTEDFTRDVKTEYSRRVRIGAGNFQSFSWSLDFLNPFKGWPAFCFVSHKVSRWFSPILLLVGLISCAGLAVLGQPLYLWILGLGVCFILAGLSSKLVPTRLTTRMFYFLLMNAALIAGLHRFLCGIRSATWNRTERGTSPAAISQSS